MTLIQQNIARYKTRERNPANEFRYVYILDSTDPRVPRFTVVEKHGWWSQEHEQSFGVRTLYRSDTDATHQFPTEVGAISKLHELVAAAEREGFRYRPEDLE